MKSFRIAALVFAISLCLMFLACSNDKKDVKTEPVTVTTTLGQELLDLKKAYDDGIITEKEYKKAKKALIEIRTEKKSD